MLNKFWEGLGESLAQQLAGRLISPAAIFWLVGLIAWVESRGGWHRVLISQSQLFQHVPVVLQVIAIVLMILVLIGSAAVMERAAPHIRAGLEGQWLSLGPGKLQTFLITRFQDRAAELRAGLSELEEYLDAINPGVENRDLSEKVDPKFTEALGRYAQIRRSLQQFPDFPEMFTPTRLGNVMSAADARPFAKYGLDTALCWPVLWLLLEKSEREDISKARAALDLHAQAWAWSLLLLVWTPLFFVWTPWSLFVVPFSLLACCLIYRSMLSAGRLYGQLLEASFDLYRDRLYTALRLPLPNDSFEERELARTVTRYLAHGTGKSLRKIRFATPDIPAEPPAAQLLPSA
jgi:hypothetical protein